MFAWKGLLSIVISTFIIWPAVILLRELSYLLASACWGIKNPRITIGSGPRFKKIGIIDIRKYYHLYSWFSYDSLKRENKFVYTCIYASPIIMNMSVALLINHLLASDVIETFRPFWDRFAFYALFYVLLDAVPMITVNGKPNNGMIIYEMLRYGKRVDYNDEPFIPETTETEKQHDELIKELEKKDKDKTKE